MVTKVRKLGTAEFLDVEHDTNDCPFCEAARSVTGSGVIFFEAEGFAWASAADVQRVEVEMAADRTCVMLCAPVTRAEAEAELSESRKG